jgi:hypothetical protein
MMPPPPSGMEPLAPSFCTVAEDAMIINGYVLRFGGSPGQTLHCALFYEPDPSGPQWPWVGWPTGRPGPGEPFEVWETFASHGRRPLQQEQSYVPTGAYELEPYEVMLSVSETREVICVCVCRDCPSRHQSAISPQASCDHCLPL